MRLTFSKLLPGGNPTILIPGEDVPEGLLHVLAARLMDPLHVGAEQVGALFVKDGMPHLEMMGGEFCVNASRAAAFEWAERRLFTRAGENAVAGQVSISGLREPIPVAVAPTQKELRACREAVDAGAPLDGPTVALSASSLFCAARIPVGDARVERLGPGETLVRLPGICHLLLDVAVHPLPGDLFAAASLERSRLHLDTEPAAGVIWCDGLTIAPLVWVAATESTHLETACGSASLALALARGASSSVLQPSGEALDIDLAEGTAWVSGRVDRIARGETWVDALK